MVLQKCTNTCTYTHTQAETDEANVIFYKITIVESTWGLEIITVLVYEFSVYWKIFINEKRQVT